LDNFCFKFRKWRYWHRKTCNNWEFGCLNKKQPIFPVGV